MARHTPFLVTYGPHTARFSDRADACGFARYICRMLGYAVEVRDRSGLVAQYDSETQGLTAEFAHLNAQGFQAEAA